MFERMKEDLQTIYERDCSAESKFEVALCYPGFHALQFHRAAHWCYVQGWSTMARFVSSLGRLFTGIDIHPAAKIGRRVFIDHGMGVVIGNTVEIGDDCTIYQGATIGGTDIGKGNPKLTIKNNVIVGAGAQILGGVTVGANAQIGPSALVLKSVAPSVTVGLPNEVVGSKRGVQALAMQAESTERLEALVKEQSEVIAELKKALEQKAETQKGEPSVKKTESAAPKARAPMKKGPAKKAAMKKPAPAKTTPAKKPASVKTKTAAAKKPASLKAKTALVKKPVSSKAKTTSTKKVVKSSVKVAVSKKAPAKKPQKAAVRKTSGRTTKA